MPALRHCLFTNAPGPRGAGYRTLFVPPGWAGRDGAEVRGWVESLRPAAATVGEPAFAANCFRVGGVLYSALARAVMGFALDEHGRGGGLLSHALLAEVSEAGDGRAVEPALLERFRELDRPGLPEQGRLEAYLARCEALPPATPASFSSGRFAELGPDFLGRLLALSAERRPGVRELRSPAETTRALAERVASAAALLPPKLRLTLRWGVGVRPFPGLGLLASPGPAEGAGEADLPLGPRTYLEWLADRSGEGRAAEMEALAGDWSIRSWDELLEALGSSARA